MNSLFLAALLTAPDVNRLADAIYLAEGGKKARVAYGILSVKVRDTKHAREVCIRTINTAMRTWDGRTDFIKHLGNRYCPPSVDPVGHSNWCQNVTYFYERPKVAR